ncbi:MAG: lactate utilization protein C [Burkholderiales bacterium]
MGARENILKRIRTARGVGPEPTAAERESTEARIREHPVGTRPGMDWETVPRFREQCIRMASTVDDVARIEEVPAAVARYLVDKQLPLRAAAWPEIAALDWSASGVAVEGRPSTGDDLVGITGAYLGVAETGTLMFWSSPETYPATSLLPETHIAVIAESRIVRTMEDAWQQARTERGELPRAVNFVSGPSRTADIEGQLQLGAHGPYRVHVIVVTGR